MAVKYQLIQNNGEKSTHKGQFYARTKITDTSTLADISEKIERNCSMKKSDVNAVLTELVEVLKDELQTSHKVDIDGLGSFQIGIKGTYAATAKAFSAGTNIKGYRVNFMPEYKLMKTGTAVNADGETYVTRTKVATLTEGITAEAY